MDGPIPDPATLGDEGEDDVVCHVYNLPRKVLMKNPATQYRAGEGQSCSSTYQVNRDLQCSTSSCQTGCKHRLIWR